MRKGKNGINHSLQFTEDPVHSCSQVGARMWECLPRQRVTGGHAGS